jgi:RNA polymerase II-associated factor 1
VDVSREAQLASIDSSFGAARASDDLNALRHPTKPRLRAVATYEVLPDADVWANAYDLFRFSERPGERGPEVRPPHTTTLYALNMALHFSRSWTTRGWIVRL